MRGKDGKRHLDCESGVVKYERVGGTLNGTNLEVRIEKARERTRGIWGERNTVCVCFERHYARESSCQGVRGRLLCAVRICPTLN